MFPASFDLSPGSRRFSSKKADLFLSKEKRESPSERITPRDSPAFYRFGAFQLNARTGELSNNGKKLQLRINPSSCCLRCWSNREANYKESPGEFNFKDDFKVVPEKTISVDPEQQGRIQVPGLGEFEVTASYLNHAFTAWGRPDEAIEPRKDEFRVVAPVLIRGKEVICNLSENGYSIDDGNPDATLMIYYPGEGRYLISRVPFEGAVEGTVKNGQIRFTLNGQDYLLLSAAPILNAEHAWVSHDAQYKLSEHLEGASDDRPWFRVRALKVVLQPQLDNID